MCIPVTFLCFHCDTFVLPVTLLCFLQHSYASSVMQCAVPCLMSLQGTGSQAVALHACNVGCVPMYEGMLLSTQTKMSMSLETEVMTSTPENQHPCPIWCGTVRRYSTNDANPNKKCLFRLNCTINNVINMSHLMWHHAQVQHK